MMFGIFWGLKKEGVRLSGHDLARVSSDLSFSVSLAKARSCWQLHLFPWRLCCNLTKIIRSTSRAYDVMIREKP